MPKRCFLWLVVILLCGTTGPAQSKRKTSTANSAVVTYEYDAPYEHWKHGGIYLKINGVVKRFEWGDFTRFNKNILDNPKAREKKGAEWRITYSVDRDGSYSLITATFTGRIITPQSSRNSNSTTDDGFDSFYASFKRVAFAADRAAIRSMMLPNFMWALDDWTPRDQVLRQMDEWKYWGKFTRAIRESRPVRCKEPWCAFGFPRHYYSGYRVAHPKLGDLLFTRDSNGDWKWSGLLGH